MLNGVSTAMVGSSGMRNTAMQMKQAVATTPASQSRRLITGRPILTAIEISRPAAAAASPANRCCTCGSFWNLS